MRKTKSFTRNFRIGYLFFFLLSFIIFLSFFFKSYQDCSNDLSRQFFLGYASLEDSLSQTVQRCTVSLHSIGYSTYTQNWLFEKPNNYNYTYRNYALYNMNNSYRSLDYCRDQYLYTSEGKLLCLNSSTCDVFYQMLEDNQLEDASLQEAFFSDIYYPGTDHSPCVFYVMPLNNIYSPSSGQTLIGAILLDLNEWMEGIHSAHQNLTDSSGILLINYKDQCVTQNPFTEEELLRITSAASDTDIRLDGQTWLLNSSAARLKEWQLVCLFPKRLFLRNVFESMKFFLLYGILFLGILWGFLLFSSHMFQGVLDTVTKQVNEISSYQKIPAAGEPAYQELLPLYTAVNVLMERLEETSIKEQQLYQAIIEQKKAELKAFKSQINSHFLFNTLSSMNNIAIIQQNQEISSLLYSLSGIFQYLIFTPSITDLASEIRAVKNYHSIMNSRFPDKYHFEYQISEEASCWYVPTMFLLPLAENTGRHGKDCHQIVSVVISAHTQENFLILSLKDDTDWKPSQEIEYYFSHIHETLPDSRFSDKEVFSLKNICNRLRLVFGEAFSIHYERMDPPNTSLILKLPQISDEMMDLLARERSDDFMTL